MPLPKRPPPPPSCETVRGSSLTRDACCGVLIADEAKEEEETADADAGGGARVEELLAPAEDATDASARPDVPLSSGVGGGLGSRGAMLAPGAKRLKRGLLVALAGGRKDVRAGGGPAEDAPPATDESSKVRSAKLDSTDSSKRLPPAAEDGCDVRGSKGESMERWMVEVEVEVMDIAPRSGATDGDALRPAAEVTTGKQQEEVGEPGQSAPSSEP
jgi:hypothetical protein